jgi:hypothetical protein
MSSQPDLACSFNARPLRPSADVDDQGVFKSTEKQLGPFMDQVCPHRVGLILSLPDEAD